MRVKITSIKIVFNCLYTFQTSVKQYKPSYSITTNNIKTLKQRTKNNLNNLK